VDEAIPCKMDDSIIEAAATTAVASTNSTTAEDTDVEMVDVAAAAATAVVSANDAANKENKSSAAATSTIKSSSASTAASRTGSSSSSTSNKGSSGGYRIPWVELYRPRTLNDVLGNEETVLRLRAIAKDGNMPNLILCGPPGTGMRKARIENRKRFWGSNVHSLSLTHTISPSFCATRCSFHLLTLHLPE
jgi:hypothetical protein